MASSPTARITFRVVLIVLVILVLFYMGRPLYWKISATIQEVRENKRTVKQGISQIVYEAQKSVGWFHHESDSGVRGDRKATNLRRMLFKVHVGDLLIGIVHNVLRSLVSCQILGRWYILTLIHMVSFWNSEKNRLECWNYVFALMALVGFLFVVGFRWFFYSLASQVSTTIAE